MEENNGIVRDMRVMAELCNKIAVHFRDQEISERMIKDDLRFLDDKKVNLQKEIEIIKSQVEEIGMKKEFIISEAQKEAERIIQLAKQNYMEASKIKKENDDLNRELKSLRYRLDKQLKEAEKEFSTVTPK